MSRKAGPSLKQVIEGLQAVVQTKQGELDGLRERNYALRLRCTAVALARRCLEEVVAHKRRHGGDTAAEEAQLEALRAAAAARGGSGAAPQRLQIPHLAPGASLTGLDRATAEEVAAIRGVDYAAAAGSVARLLSEGRRLVDQLYPPAPPPGAAADDASGRAPGGPGGADGAAGGRERDPAAAALAGEVARVGAAIRRIYMLLVAWAPGVLLQLSSRHHQTGGDILEVPGLPCRVYDQALTRGRLSREQALLFMENCQLLQDRVRKLGAQRACIAAELSRLDAARALDGPSGGAASSGSAASSGGAASSGSAAGGGAPGASRAGGGSGPQGWLTGSSSGGGGGGGADWIAAATAAAHAGPAVRGQRPRSWAAPGGSAAGGAAARGGPGAVGREFDWDDLSLTDYSGLTQAELVECLAVNSACEKEVLVLHGMISAVVPTDEQMTYVFCAAYPHPVNMNGVLESLCYLLVADGGAALPWAGPPWGGAAR